MVFNTLRFVVDKPIRVVRGKTQKELTRAHLALLPVHALVLPIDILGLGLGLVGGSIAALVTKIQKKHSHDEWLWPFCKK